MLIEKPIRYMSEVNTSVEDSPRYFQEGLVASKINTAYTFLPCGISDPRSVYITPVKTTNSANGVAFFTTTGGWQVDSLSALSAVTDLDAFAQGVAYEIGTIVSSGGVGYVCNTAYTSTDTSGGGGTADDDFATDIANWTELNETSFIKLTHTAAGSSKVANFNYKIEGYNND